MGHCECDKHAERSYSKIVDANGTPLWHTTVLTNGGWDTNYLPVLKKDHLVASAEIQNGVLAFANLYCH